MNIDMSINLVAIIFFAGVYWQTVKNHDKQIGKLEQVFNNTIEEIKNDFNAKFKDFKNAVNEHFIRVEKKQDFHNKVIERTYILERRTDVQEEQIKVANHRIEDLERRN